MQVHISIPCITCIFMSLACAAAVQNGFDSQQESKVTPKDINKLISDLSSNDFKTRESASKRLVEIGEPALKFLENAERAADPEAQARARMLMANIRKSTNLAPVEKGLEFKLVADAEWVCPEAGTKTPIKIHLIITNTKEAAVQVPLAQVLSVSLKDERGIERISPFGQERSVAKSRISPVLQKGQSVTIELEGELSQEKTGLFVYCRDVFSFYWQTKAELKKGPYKLSLRYTNNKPASQTGELLWIGKVESNFQTVTLK